MKAYKSHENLKTTIYNALIIKIARFKKKVKLEKENKEERRRKDRQINSGPKFPKCKNYGM